MRKSISMTDLKTITILFRTQNKLESIIREDVRCHGLNTSEFGALEVLYHKGPLPVQAIKEKVLIASSSMSYVIERLLVKDLITKIISPKDNRVHHVHLSQKGKDLMDEIYPKHVQTLRQTLNILTNEEELQLQNLLKKIGKAQ
jgi:MarR family 2-MHQ and catechol resistance regulon transcriptional repressor